MRVNILAQGRQQDKQIKDNFPVWSTVTVYLEFVSKVMIIRLQTNRPLREDFVSLRLDFLLGQHHESQLEPEALGFGQGLATELLCKKSSKVMAEDLYRNI